MIVSPFGRWWSVHPLGGIDAHTHQHGLVQQDGVVITLRHVIRVVQMTTYHRGEMVECVVVVVMARDSLECIPPHLSHG